MTDCDVEKIAEKIARTKHQHCGTIDEEGFRGEQGCEQWFNNSTFQKYSGQFLYNNLHEKGTFLIADKNQQLYLDGTFRLNKLEGYGKVVYFNGKTFEGLFKEHERFGPGVLTYPNTSQDVGIWNGFSLIKLAFVCGKVPRLATTSIGKARLLKFRNLVPLGEETVDVAKDILKNLGAGEKLLQQSDQLYNKHTRHQESLFLNQKWYQSDQNSNIEVAVSKEEFAAASKSDHDRECLCFRKSLDQFTRTCVQLHEIELKLEELSLKKKTLEKTLQECKSGCDKVCSERQQVKREPSKDATLQDQQTLLSLRSASLRHGWNITDSETELNNYLYHLMDSEDVFDYLLQEPYSSTTLPFQVRPSMTNTINKSSEVGVLPDFDLDFSEESCVCQDEYTLIEEQIRDLDTTIFFYNTVKHILKKQLDVEFQRFNEVSKEEERYTIKVKVDNLLAWNNEKLWISVLKHCFRHRNNEDNVTFSVHDLLTGHRKLFAIPGVYESSCRSFLEACLEDTEKRAFSLLRTFNIDPNLCDAKGNTGLMMAAVANKVHVIAMLVRCGVNVDGMNDEGLTPLTMTLLIYTAVKRQVSDWEKAFLDEEHECEEVKELLKWRCIESGLFNEFDVKEGFGTRPSKNDTLLNQALKRNWSQLPEHKLSEMNQKLANLDFTTMFSCYVFDSGKEQSYIFNTDYIKVAKKKHKEKKKRKKGKKKQKKKPKPKKEKAKDAKSNESIVDDEVQRQLELTKKTALTLLSYGSDPNLPEVPMRPLFLAIFAEDSEIVRKVLENKANLNETITEDKLSPLHVVASLKPSSELVKICKVLLEFNVDANLRTTIGHWNHLRNELIGDCVNKDEIFDEGKNALQMVCLREDFVNDSSGFLAEMAKVLVTRGTRTEEFYLGHSPLSLAVLRGNVRLIKVLLKSRHIDPHISLGNDMGNALTVLMLQRFASLLTGENQKEVVDCLLDNGLNPLNKICDFENSIAFMKAEEKISVTKKGKRDKKKKPSKKTKRKKKSKKNVKKKSNKKQLLLLKKHIEEKTRKIIFKHLQGRVAEFLYTLMAEATFTHPLLATLAKYLTPQEALSDIELLLEYGVIDSDGFSQNTVLEMIQFVRQQHDFSIMEEKSTEIDNKLKNFSVKKFQIKPNSIYLPPPEVDRDEEKYKVCFQCLQGEGKNLVKCPNCELVYFCSENCNLVNMKTCPYHHCNVVFYNSESEKIEQASKMDALLEMADKVRKEKLAYLQLEYLQGILAKLKFISSARKREFEGVFQDFVKFKAEREIFGKKKNLSIVGNIPSFPQDVLDHSRNSHPLCSRHTTELYLTALRKKLTKNTVKSETKFSETKKMPKVSSKRAVKKHLKPTVNLTKVFNYNITRDLLSMIDKGKNVQSSAKEKSKLKDNDYYVQLLSKIFTDFNLSLLLLPYACYKNGQIYYSMANTQNRNSFQKLKII